MSLCPETSIHLSFRQPLGVARDGRGLHTEAGAEITLGRIVDSRFNPAGMTESDGDELGSGVQFREEGALSDVHEFFETFSFERGPLNIGLRCLKEERE